jgi:multimeric flavodoxin WrbA
MKIIAFNGSPRKKGNTELLIKEVFKPMLKAGIECEIVQIGGNALRGCSACYSCFKTKNGRCSMVTDKMNDFLAKVHEADAIILASPTYYGSVTAEMKAFMDRLGLTTIGLGRTLTRKIGAAVVSVRRGGAVTVFDELNRFMLGSGMIVPGSTYWNFGIGEGPGDVLNDKEGLRNMEDLGLQLTWLMKALVENPNVEKNYEIRAIKMSGYQEII